VWLLRALDTPTGAQCMAKTNQFSIFLLKDGFNANNSLTDEHQLEPAANATNIPQDSTLYILDNDPKRPWWRGYFGITEDIWQSSKGALLFLPVGQRCFALAFGMVSHNLRDTSYEYDFGLLVTLNSVDPDELRSTDKLSPGDAKRTRTQVPISTDLPQLDFDGDSDIIKSLTGKVKPRYQSIFKNATGSISLKIGLQISPDKLTKLCRILLTLYKRDSYKTKFPNIQNIVPLRDPTLVSPLNQLLLNAFRARAEDLTLTIPDMVDYRDYTCCEFAGGGLHSNIYPDISIEQFFDYLGDTDLATIDLETLKHYRLILTDADGSPGPSYGIFRALIFEATLPNDNSSYHFRDGVWFKVQSDYVLRLKAYLDSKCEITDLCPYNHDLVVNNIATYSEGNYNASVPQWNQRFICLDKTDIRPRGNSAIEPCDLYSSIGDPIAKRGNRAVFYHVKISTRSAQLSHLVNQGTNSIDLITIEPPSMVKLRNLIQARIGTNNLQHFLNPLEDKDFKVVFAIITHKPSNLMSDNIPLFSKITLTKNFQHLDLLKVPCALTFVQDNSPHKGAIQKYFSVIGEVQLDNNGGTVIKAIPGQGFDNAPPISGCPKVMKMSAVGTRFRVTVKSSANGFISSYHSWEFEQLP
jgi:uncharacterized protein (TIGR04141 family)